MMNDDSEPGSRASRRFWARWLVCLAVAIFWAAGCSDDSHSGGDAHDARGGDAVTQPDADQPLDAGPQQPEDAHSADMDSEDATPDAAPADAASPDADRTPDVLPDLDANDLDTHDRPDAGPVLLRVEAVSPARGPLAGGTPFAISGSGFSPQTAVFFGATRAAVSLVEHNLVGQTPPGAGAGPVHVKVVDPARGTASLADGFTYTADLKIDAINPARLPTEGGVEVTLSGQGFDADTRVSFGGHNAVRHTPVSPTLMRVLAPAHAAGMVDVRLSNRDGSDVLPAGAEYFEALRVDAIRPASGLTAGGQSATIFGRALAPGLQVNLGQAAAQVVSVASDGSRASILTPPGTAGFADLQVTLPGGEAATRADAYYYYEDADAFVLASVTPAQGMVTGGAQVTVVGAGLDALGLQVEFGGAAATLVEQGPGHATLRVPAHPAGVVDVVARDGAGAASTLSQAFTYVDALQIDSAQPDSADVAGGAAIVLRGRGFSGVQRVEFGQVAAQFQVVSDTEIEAIAPPHAAGVVDIALTRDIQARLSDGFTFTEALAVHGISPARGSIAGNTWVQLRGQGFGGAMAVEFDGIAASDVQVVDAQTLTLRTPPHPSGAVDVTVHRGAQSRPAPDRYVYFNPGARQGGVWGAPIAGAVNVMVFERGVGPIADAWVQLSTRADALYAGHTDANGLITLSGPHVFGPQTVTAVAAGFSSATVQRVNAENITVFLERPPEGDGSMPPGQPAAVFTGRLTGLNKIAQTADDEILMAMVRVTRPHPWAQNMPDPGPDAVLYSDGVYRVNSRFGDLALIAVGGVYNTTTLTFTPLMMGVERYLVGNSGQVQAVDLHLDIELNQSMRFKLANAQLHADGPHFNQVVPWLDLGFEGVFGELGFAQGVDDLIRAEHLPALGGKLAGARWWAIGGAYTQDFSYPRAESFKKNISDMSATVQMPVLPPIARVTSPQELDAPTDGLVHFAIDSLQRPDFWYVQVLTFEMLTVWEAFVDGEATSFRFPDFPDFSHLPPDERPVPYPGGYYQLLIIGVNQRGTSVDQFSYADLSLDQWDSYSLWLQILGF